MRLLAACWAACAVGCVGVIGEASDDVALDLDDVDTGIIKVARVEPRRLTRAEYVQTLRDLLDPEVPVPIEYLAVDEGVPFDNDVALQHVTPVVIEGADVIAESAAAWVMARPAVKARIYGCAPRDPSDLACFTSFVDSFGRRAFRRPLTDDERAVLLGLHAFSVDEGAFDSGAELVLRVLLSHPVLLYRFEPGVATQPDGTVTLSAFEVATRLSFLLAGTTPDDTLLELAASGALLDSEVRAAQADRLLATTRAQDHWQRFHAMWLGYSRLADADPLSRSMRAESNALVAASIFGGARDYAELFSSARTWVDAPLAAHYGFPAPPQASGGWVDYPVANRRGILAHGSVLGYGTKSDDTSPTRRGIFIRTRLFCEANQPLPDDVNIDQEPQGETPDACKVDRYAAHGSGACATCHRYTDPVGFGLENFDALGRYRTHDDGRPECVIAGKGEVADIGTFSGPAELGALVLSSGLFESCVGTKVYGYALGRPLRAEDRPLARALGEALAGSGRRFASVLRTLVADPTFILRREVMP